MPRAAASAVTLTLLLATFALGVAVAMNRGAYEERGLVFVVMGILSLAAAFAQILVVRANATSSGASAGSNPPARFPAQAVWLMLATSLAWAWSDQGLIMYAQKPWDAGHTALSAMLALLATYVPPLFGLHREPRSVRLLRFAAFAVLVLVAGLDTIKTSPRPNIDVWTTQQLGAEAILRGDDPYTVVRAPSTTPNFPYNPYVYAPIQILLDLPSYLLGHDVRYTMLLALLVVGGALRLATWRARDLDLPAIIEDGPGLFIWCTPKLFFLVEQSWVNPVQLALVSTGCVLLLYEKRWAGIIILGLASSSKASLFWVLPLAGFGFRFTRREWLVAVAAAAAPVLPFAFWDFASLKASGFDMNYRATYRSDGLTFTGWLNRHYQWHLEGKEALPLAGIVAALSCWKLRGPAAVAVALALTYAVFFAFNKWAFTNYYFFVGGLAALGAACALGSLRAAEVSAPAE